MQDEIIAKGATLVAIGNGTPAMARGFVEETGFSGALFSDPERKTYKVLGCKKGIGVALTMKTIKAGKVARKDGYKQGKTAGNATQIGGAFVLSLSRGVLFAHLEQFAVDQVDFEKLLEAL